MNKHDYMRWKIATANKYTWNNKYWAAAARALPFLSTTSVLYQRLKVYFNILDREPDQIAEFLASVGVTGIRQSPEQCPVAVYLRRTPAFRSVRVWADSVAIEGRATTLPANVCLFIRRFDHGRYPDLVR